MALDSDDREYLDGILSFVGAESMTDLEFNALTITNVANDVANYNALVGVLNSRELVSSQLSRLSNYYLAKGTDIDVADQAKSNIFIGGAL